MELIFASHNEHKVKEIQKLLPSNFNVKSLTQIGLKEEIPETAPTIEGNAIQKALYVYEKCNVNCFSDDTGLEVEALDGEPGVYSARYAGEQKNDKENVEKLLRALSNKANRKARFRTVMALVIAGDIFTFEGIVTGHIALAPRGNQGFGYDPVFVPEDEGITFAEMTAVQKNNMSHRGRALNKLVDWLKNYKD